MRTHHLGIQVAKCTAACCSGGWGSARQLIRSCGPLSFSCHEGALVESFYFVDNFYHFLYDNLFPAFMTLIHISQYLNIDADNVEMVSMQGFDYMYPFTVLWGKLLGPVKDHASLNGCYRNVFFGNMFEQRMIHWPDTHRKWLVDPVLRSWVTAYAWNHRQVWLLETQMWCVPTGALVPLHVFF